MSVAGSTASGTGHGATIDADKACSNCGYSLRGLRIGSNCPECGTPVGRRVTTRFADNLVDSEMWYLRSLVLGFGLMAGSLLGTIGWMVFTGWRSQQWAPLHPLVVSAGFFIASGAWLAGVFITTLKRPRNEHTVRDVLLDSVWVRQSARLLQLLPVAATGLGLAATATGGGTAAVFAVFAGLAAIAGFFGLVPLCVYHASLADWAGDTGIGDRLRAAAWSIAVCGTFGVICFLILLIPGLRFKLLVTVGLVLASIITFIGGVLLFLGVLQLALASLWAVQNSTSARAREQRIAVRKAEEEEQSRARAEAAEAEQVAELEAREGAGDVSPFDDADEDEPIPLAEAGEEAPPRALPDAVDAMLPPPSTPEAQDPASFDEESSEKPATYDLEPEKDFEPGRP